MKSKANIKGHPLHPILVSFPIAFFTGALLLDLLAFVTGNTSYVRAAIYSETGGLLFGIAAAVPGIIDYFFTVPPESSAKKRATQHGLLNTTVMLIFVMTLLLRLKSGLQLPLILAMEAVGVVIMTAAGWLGGTLVTRNQIGIDHRYAQAGKWRENVIRTDQALVALKDPEKLKLNQMLLLHVNEKRIVVARTEAGLVAFDDHCTHRGGSLADGVLICGTVQCPWHGSQFEAATGHVKAGPAKENIRTYELREENGVTVLRL